jgi:hypothetical protein
VIRGVAGSGHREEILSKELCFVPISEGNSCFLLRWGRFIIEAIRDALYTGAGNMPDTGARTICHIGYNHHLSRII